MRNFLGKERPGGWHCRRPHLSGCNRPARQAQDSADGNDAAQLRLCFCGLGEILQRIRATGGADRGREVAGDDSANGCRQPVAYFVRQRRRGRGAGRRRWHSILALLGKAVTRAGGVVWAHRDEYATATATGIPGIAGRDISEEVIQPLVILSIESASRK